jgi:hypothetical protein
MNQLDFIQALILSWQRIGSIENRELVAHIWRLGALGVLAQCHIVLKRGEALGSLLPPLKSQ